MNIVMVKNILIEIIRYLLLILAVASSIAAAFILWLQTRTIEATTLPMELDKYVLYRLFPGYHLLPLIGIMLALFYLYIYFKLKTRSKKIWWITVSSLTVIPVTHISLALLVTSSVSKGEITENFSWTQTLLELININYKVFVSIFSSVSVISICIFLLIITYNRFNEQSKPLPIKIKYLLGVYSLILIVPITTITMFGFYHAYNLNDDYTRIQQQVNFKIYKATYLPTGLKQRTKYFINNAKGVNVMYVYGDLRDIYLNKPQKEGTIIISQSKTSTNNLLEKALKNKLPDDQTTEIELASAKDKKALLFTNPRTNDRFVFTTNDEVSIQILGNHIDHEEYLRIAERLK
jgi:hypothetical protein